jgi:hypothetical protein
MIGVTRNQLYAAATGQQAPPETPPINSAYGKALASYVEPSYGGFQQAMGMGGYAPNSNAGRSPKGKYSGFQTMGDLTSAISGDAMYANQQGDAYAADLRDLANSRMGQYGRDFQSLYGVSSPAVSGYPQMSETTPQASMLPEDVLAYRTQALDKMKSSVPNLQQTSQQIQDTPRSAYARAIATRDYGMNPSLAANEFSTDYDKDIYGQELDQNYMDAFGMPYDTYRQQTSDMRADENYAYQLQQREQAALTDEEKQAQTDSREYVSGLTGMDAKKLEVNAGLNYGQLRSIISGDFDNNGEINIDLGEAGYDQEGNLIGDRNNTFTAYKAQIDEYIGNNETQDVLDLINKLFAEPGTIGLARALYGYARSIGTLLPQTEKTLQQFTDAYTGDIYGSGT